MQKSPSPDSPDSSQTRDSRANSSQTRDSRANAASSFPGYLRYLGGIFSSPDSSPPTSPVSNHQDLANNDGQRSTLEQILKPQGTPSFHEDFKRGFYLFMDENLQKTAAEYFKIELLEIDEGENALRNCFLANLAEKGLSEEQQNIISALHQGSCKPLYEKLQQSLPGNFSLGRQKAHVIIDITTPKILKLTVQIAAHQLHYLHESKDEDNPDTIMIRCPAYQKPLLEAQAEIIIDQNGNPAWANQAVEVKTTSAVETKNIQEIMQSHAKTAEKIQNKIKNYESNKDKKAPDYNSKITLLNVAFDAMLKFDLTTLYEKKNNPAAKTSTIGKSNTLQIIEQMITAVEQRLPQKQINEIKEKVKKRTKPHSPKNSPKP